MYESFSFVNGVKKKDGISVEKVVDKREIDNETCYRIKFVYDWRTPLQRLLGAELDPDDDFYYWEYLDDKGSFHFDEESGPPSSIDDFELTLPYPTTVGYQYEFDNSSYEVMATNQSVTVPAGTFSCVIYAVITVNPDDSKERYTMSMAPGIGLILAEFDVWENGAWIPDYREELYEYGLGVLPLATEDD